MSTKPESKQAAATTTRPPLTPEEHKARREKRQEAKVTDAKKFDSVVIVPNSTEVECLLHVVQQINNFTPQVDRHSGAFGSITETQRQNFNLHLVESAFQLADLGHSMASRIPKRFIKFFVPRNMEKAYAAYRKAKVVDVNAGKAAPKDQIGAGSDESQAEEAAPAVEKKAPAKKRTA